jgi:hypothetical protein
MSSREMLSGAGGPPQKRRTVNFLRFEMNVPREVVLQSAQGTRVEGRYGDRVMFTLTDGHVMYVPADRRQQNRSRGHCLWRAVPAV